MEKRDKNNKKDKKDRNNKKDKNSKKDMQDKNDMQDAQDTEEFKEFNLSLTGMAHGGSALGRDNRKRVVFVAGGIPGETVQVRVPEGDGKKQSFVTGELLEVVKKSDDRVKPRSAITYGTEFQHIAYKRQLAIKVDVIADQLRRLAKLKPTIKPAIPSPDQWEYLTTVTLSPTEDGKFGVWSPADRKVVRYETSHLLRPALDELIRNFDLELPDLRKITFRIGDDGELLAGLEVNSVEPPELQTDFPISVTLVLPDRTAANLIGENYTVQEINGHNFRASAGSHYQPNPAAFKKIIDTVLHYAYLDDTKSVLELYSGVGALTYFLAEKAKEVVTIEVAPDAINDLSVNLNETENVSAYQGWVEAVLPDLEMSPDVIVVDPPDEGLSKFVIEELARFNPSKFIYVSSDVAKLGRDAKLLTKAGYVLQEVQPVDLLPQTFRVHTVSLWHKPVRKEKEKKEKK